MRSSHRLPCIAPLAVAALVACTDAPVTSPRLLASDATLSVASADDIAAFMDALNAQLESAGAPYRAAVADYTTASSSGQAGGTVLSKSVGNKRLADDFVAFDPRRASWSGVSSGPSDDITFAIDETGDAVPVFGGLTAAQTNAAILTAMSTWESVNCSTLPLTANPSFGLDVGLVAFLNGLGGSPFVFADVQHAGWRDINFAGGILGVTFTFVFVDGSDRTDVDGNGLADVAFREIYYDPSFSWANDGVANIDVESVALHEVGHGLSQAHFGTVRLKNDGSLMASPRAVMNALYAAPMRQLQGSDNGGHCSNWANWPNQ